MDPKRVYLTGHSNGGSLATLIAIGKLAEIAAIAPSAAGISAQYLMGATCPGPTPAMVIHSKNDGLFPVAMGFGKKPAEWWASCAMCGATPADMDGCSVWATCASSTEVRYCETTGQHGQWASNLNEPMLDFFDRFKR